MMHMMLSPNGPTVQRGFFDREAVIRSIDTKERRVLSRAGSHVRRRAQTSMRPARFKRWDELSKSEWAKVRRINNARAAKGLPRLARPPFRAPSQPGEPPRYHTKKLRDGILFAYDPALHSVVIGPVKLSGTPGEAPKALERGGRTHNPAGRVVEIRPRPYMGPAFQAETPNFLSLWSE